LTHQDYFSQLTSALDRPERLEMARREGRKTVALVGVTVPEELFWACGAVPISLGGFVANVGVGAQHAAPSIGENLPRDVCAAVRTTFDLLAHHWIPAGLVDAVVVAGGCDWITRLSDRFKDTMPVWPMNVWRAVARRTSAGEKGTDFAPSTAARLGSLERMLNALERLTDLPLTRQAFKAARARAMALDALCDRLDRLRLGSPPAIRASDYYRIVGALDLADPKRWVEVVEDLIRQESIVIRPQESKIQNLKSKIQNPRVILSGCPTGFPDLSLIELIEQTGFQIVGEDFGAHGNGGRKHEWAGGGRRAILEWAAETLEAGQLANLSHENRRAAGMIRVHYRGCAVTAMEAARAQLHPAERDLTVLTLEIEQVPPAPEALRTRLEAFREQLKNATTDCTARRSRNQGYIRNPGSQERRKRSSWIPEFLGSL
jgi:benzoyl-CoA reductase/2-hydroxyglutaryl-CoA dehydratase subunit BcrC/BadD/HgdB